MMQQQMNQQEQCGNPQQLPQPMMLCPVQYVYETPMLLPQPQDDQIQQNQIMINVKNPPPWIQNRTQNQVVYVQQLPNNYQPYFQPQMIQNPIYHPQMSYQIQPIITQDNRQFVQIPNLNNFNMVHNPTAQIQQQVNEDSEKMPLLTQMLSQRVINSNNLRASNLSNVRPTSNITAVANVAPTANAIRPVTQNQQVQTDISANTKGRPRNAPPQIITINPMQQRQFLANHKQEIQMNVRPTASIRSDVPQHIRTKIPSSISVKTINRPILPRSMIKPFEVMPAPQNFYYSPIIMTAPNTEAANKSTTTNTEYPFVKSNNNVQNSPKTMPMQLSMPISNVPPVIKTELKNPSEIVTNTKQTTTSNVIVKSNINSVKVDHSIQNTTTESSTQMNTESQTQTEEKLIRNTVFVQARGRVLNEKEIVQNHSLKRTTDDRLKEENKPREEASNIAEKTENMVHSSSKYTKVEHANSSLEINKIPVNSPAANTPVSIQTQQCRISNLQMNRVDMKTSDSNKLETEKYSKTVDVNIKNSEEPNPKENIHLDEINASNISTERDEDIKDKRNSKKLNDKENDDAVLKKNSDLKDLKKKDESVTVLTHVLEGYIIQESNVAFPIQKPTIEKEIKRERDGNTAKVENKQAQAVKKEDCSNEKLKSKGHFPWRYLNSSIESEKEMEFAAVDKDEPFVKIKKSTVESWTAEQLSSHLETFGWNETAEKLLDEEIDGESILLVNKDQLVAIGVNETHAEVIVAFAAS